MTPIGLRKYTTAEVFQLELLDQPFLMVYYKDEWQPIQTSSIDEEDVIKAFPDMLWKYIRTTREWIPLFYCEESEKALEKLEVIIDYDHEGLYIKKGTIE